MKVQVGLCQTWSETPKTVFLASRLMFYVLPCITVVFLAWGLGLDFKFSFTISSWTSYSYVTQEERTGQKPGPKKVVISRNMDLILQEVIDLLLRDYVCSWYKGLSRNQEGLLSFLE